MTGTIVHPGIGIQYLIERIREVGNKGIIERDGVALPDGEAMTYLDGERAKGRRIMSDCPIPQADGGCPGHPIES